MDFKEARLISQPFKTFLATWGKAKKKMMGIESYALGQNLGAPEPGWKPHQSTLNGWNGFNHAHPCAPLLSAGLLLHCGGN